MNASLMELIKELASNDNFAKTFSEKKTADEKYSFVKTRFTGYSKKDFMECLGLLNNISNTKLKLSEGDLSTVNGGLGILNSKLAALALMGITLGAPISANVAMAETPQFYKEVSSTTSPELLKHIMHNTLKIMPENLNNQISKLHRDILRQNRINVGPSATYNDVKDMLKTLFRSEEQFNEYVDKVRQIYFYKDVANQVQKMISEDKELEEQNIFISGKNYLITLKSLRHIIYGDFSQDFALLKGGGHSQKSLDMTKLIAQKKLSVHKDNPLRDNLRKEVFQNSRDSIKLKNIFSNGVSLYELLDASDGHAYLKTFFPKGWSTMDIVDAIHHCIEVGTTYSTYKKNIKLYIAKINNVCMTTCIDTMTNSIISAYPIEDQEPRTNVYSIDNPKKPGMKLYISEKDMHSYDGHKFETQIASKKEDSLLETVKTSRPKQAKNQMSMKKTKNEQSKKAKQQYYNERKAGTQTNSKKEDSLLKTVKTTRPKRAENQMATEKTKNEQSKKAKQKYYNERKVGTQTNSKKEDSLLKTVKTTRPKQAENQMATKNEQSKKAKQQFTKEQDQRRNLRTMKKFESKV